MRTQRIDIKQAKEQFAELVADAAEGNEIVIIENNKPLARLVPPADSAYQSLPPSPAEFSSDEEALAWDADGWENVA